MSDSHAEALDPSQLGEQVGDDDAAAVAANYPPEEPLGLDDPALTDTGEIIPDDVESRERRLVEERVRPEHDHVAGLIADGDGIGETDHESQMVADSGDDDEGPEAGAMHIER